MFDERCVPRRDTRTSRSLASKAKVYDKNIEIDGKIFNDPDFGHHYNRDGKETVGEELVKSIAEKIKAALPGS